MKARASVSQSPKSHKNITNCMILPVLLFHKNNPDLQIMVYDALLDDASDITFVSAKVLEDLKTTGVNVKLDMSTMLGTEEIPT